MDIPGVNVRFKDFSRNGGNYAITNLSYTRTKSGITVLSRIACFSPKPSNIPVSLYVDGKVFDAKNASTVPGEIANIYWNHIPSNALSLECRIDTEDNLDGDNRAWTPVNPVKISKVLLASSKNVFIEKALSSAGGIELYKTGTDKSQQFKGYDLYIFDGFLPEELPGDGNLMLFNPPQNEYFGVKGELDFPKLQKTTHQFFNYIYDYPFYISKAKSFDVPKWGQSALETDKGTVAFSGTLGNRRLAVFGFDLHNTDIALTHAFPILMTNCLDWLVSSRIKNMENLLPGQGIEFNLDPKAQEVQVKSPSGQVTMLAPPFPARIFDNTQELGLYTLEQKFNTGKSLRYFAVNAPADKESDLATGGRTAGNTDSKAQKKSIPVSTGLNLQALLLWIVLIVLIIEWWVYKNEC